MSGFLMSEEEEGKEGNGNVLAAKFKSSHFRQRFTAFYSQ